MTRRPLQVALHTGVLLRHDAISTSLLRKLRLLRRLGAGGVPVEVTGFAAYTDADEPGLEVVPRTFDRLASRSFRRADVHVWEYGISYQGFDAVFATPRWAANLAIYHNVTPVELAADNEAKAVLQHSLDRRHSLSHMHHVACVSEFNRADLLDLGLDPARLSVVPLPPGHRPRRDQRRRPTPGEPVRLLFVGRLTKAKGVCELVEAVARSVASAPPFTLDLVGNLAFSDPATLAWVLERIAHDELGNVVRLVGQLEDDELAAAYAAADALVLPSHHEGLCIPVIEALGAGCAVVTTAAGNLPDVLGGFGWIVPVGDVASLGAALTEVVHRLSAAKLGAAVQRPSPTGEVALDVWAAGVDRHLERYSEAAHQRGFLQALGTALEAAHADVPSWIRQEAA